MKKDTIKTTVGGQAVMEGVMMRGPQKWCLAVKTPENTIVTEVHDVDAQSGLFKIPFVRGIYSFVSSLLLGYKTLMRSAQLATTEEEFAAGTSKFEKWLEKRLGDKVMNVVMIISAVLAMGLSLVLFMVLPTFLVGLINKFLPLGFFKGLVEGVLKIGIFVAYLSLVSLSKDIKRVFAYHGAEHKTIFCYEAGEALTVENVRKQPRFHPRCGTSFMIIVLIVSIVVFSVVSWDNVAFRVLLKLLLLPLVMAISYELIRIAGRHNNIFTRILSAPGLLLQRLTTKQPDDGMIELAIAAILPVLPENPEEAKW